MLRDGEHTNAFRMLQRGMRCVFTQPRPVFMFLTIRLTRLLSVLRPFLPRFPGLVYMSDTFPVPGRLSAPCTRSLGRSPRNDLSADPPREISFITWCVFSAHMWS